MTDHDDDADRVRPDGQGTTTREGSEMESMEDTEMDTEMDNEAIDGDGDQDQDDIPPLPKAVMPSMKFTGRRGNVYDADYSKGRLEHVHRFNVGNDNLRRRYLARIVAKGEALKPPVKLDQAEQDDILAQLEDRARRPVLLPAPAPAAGAARPGAADDGYPRLRNYEEVPREGGEGTVRRALAIDEIADRVNELVGDKFKRVDDQVFIESADHRPIYVDRHVQLFSILAEAALVEWDHGGGFVGQDHFFEFMRRSAPNFKAIETMPHEPPMAGAYYMHPPLPPPGGKLDGFLAKFSPATDLDRDLMKAFVVQPFWGGKPGHRPAGLITGPEGDPKKGVGIGKSIFVDLVADELCGGALDVGANEDIRDIKTRLLSPSGRQLRFVRIDNLKSLKFSWADLEGMITAPEISGKQLYKGEGRRPNTLTVAITMNGGSMSKDMASRSSIIELKRPEYAPKWESDARAYAADNRWAIIADIVELLKKEVQEVKAATRWAAWEQGVLARSTDDLAGCQALLLARQGQVDADDGEQGDVREYFEKRLRENRRKPETCHVLSRPRSGSPTRCASPSRPTAPARTWAG
jgi:hypothetical protein